MRLIPFNFNSSAALARYDQACGLYRSAHQPDDGRRHGQLGDVIFAEPRAIKATIRIELPDGFQTSEFLLAHGFVDRIVSRSVLKSEIARVIDYCGK